jgi:ribosomal protein S17E
MGKIKSKAIKKTAKELHKQGIGQGSFNENKLILGNTMPSKKVRNQVAGLLAKLKKKSQ